MAKLDIINCVDFTRYTEEFNWGTAKIRLGWFKITWNGPRQPYISIDHDGIRGLSFHGSGLNIAVAEPVEKMTITIESWYTLDVTVFDVVGNILSQQNIQGERRPKTLDFSFDKLGSVHFGSSRSARVLDICIPPVDFSARINKEIEAAIQSNPALAEYFTGLNVSSIVDELLNMQLQSTLSDEDDGANDNGTGGDGFFPTSWPPDWNCFFKNVAGLLVAAALVYAAGAVLGPGVATIPELIIPELIKLGFSEATATALTYTVGGMAFATAFAGQCD